MSKVQVKLKTNSIDFGVLDIATFEREGKEIDLIHKSKLIKFESKFFNVESVELITTIYGQIAVIFATNQCGDIAALNNFNKDLQKLK